MGNFKKFYSVLSEKLSALAVFESDDNAEEQLIKDLKKIGITKFNKENHRQYSNNEEIVYSIVDINDVSYRELLGKLMKTGYKIATKELDGIGMVKYIIKKNHFYYDFEGDLNPKSRKKFVKIRSLVSKK